MPSCASAGAKANRTRSRWPGNRTVEIVWTAIPCVIVVALFVLTARTMSVSDPAPAPEPDLVVTGHQWWWEARYPKSGVVAANEIHIPVGQGAVRAARIGGCAARILGAGTGAKDHDRPGASEPHLAGGGQAGNLSRRLLGILRDRACLDAFPGRRRSRQQSSRHGRRRNFNPPSRRPGGAAADGLALFQADELRELPRDQRHRGARASVGPDLTHFASRRQLGAGIADNTPENLRRWLADPQQVKPGVKMPDFKFTDEQVDAARRLLRDIEMNEIRDSPRSRPALLSAEQREHWQLAWLSTVDHKRIGILYMLTALVFFVVGGIEALLIRLQLAVPNNTSSHPDTYNMLFTMHGTTMIFLVAMPVLFGFANYIVPLQIGARDMAFPAPQRVQLLAGAAGRHAAAFQLPGGRRAGGGLVRVRAAERDALLLATGRGLLGAGAAGPRHRSVGTSINLHRHRALACARRT